MMMMMMMTVMMIASKSSRLPCLSPAAMLQDFFTSAIWFVGSNYWLVCLFICLLIGSNYYFVIFFAIIGGYMDVVNEDNLNHI